METRQLPRIPIELNTKINVDHPDEQGFNIAKKNIEAKIIDISILGICMLSKYFIPRGVIIKFDIKIKDETLESKGEVRSAVPAGTAASTRLGVQFVDMSSEYRNKIADFIKEYERRAMPRIKIPDKG